MVYLCPLSLFFSFFFEFYFVNCILRKSRTVVRIPVPEGYGISGGSVFTLSGNAGKLGRFNDESA